MGHDVVRLDLEVEDAVSEQTALTPAMIMRAASTVIGTWPTRSGTRNRMPSIQTPASTPAHRLCAPTLTLSAVCPTEPPAGMPDKRPLAAFATPCATMSLDAWTRLPSGILDALAHAGALERDHHCDRKRRQEQVRREQREARQRQHGQAARHGAHVDDALNVLQSKQRDENGRHDDRDQRGEAR